MTRRISILVAIIGVNLMACCCGGVGNTPALPQQQQQVAKIEEPPAQDEFRFGEPEPSFVFKKPFGTIRAVQEQLFSTGNGNAGQVTMRVDKAAIYNEHSALVLKLMIHNHGAIPIQYEPFNSAGWKVLSAVDEYGDKFDPIGVPAIAGKAIAAKRQIASSETITDYVAYKSPGQKTHEINVRLPGSSVGISGHVFTLRIGRKSFGKEEDDRLEKIEEARQFTLFKTEHSEWLARKETARLKHLDSEKAKQENWLAAAAKKKAIDEANAEAARKAQLAEIEARKPKVTRENYNKVTQNMSLKEAQEILGPGKEVSQSGGLQVITWEHRPSSFGERVVIISMTFYNGGMKSKSIID